MEVLEQNLSVSMLRPDLADIPQCPLPRGYGVRPYRRGDGETWTAIHQLAEPYIDIGEGFYEKEFGSDEEVLAQRQYFLLDGDNRPIGTVSAWWNDEYQGLPWGVLHWLAIVPAAQGKGLAKPLVSLVLNRLHSLGHQRAKLGTSTGRFAAIRLYLDFGFVPDPRNDAEERAWQQVEALHREGHRL